jgi:hypothetical protein
VCENCYKINRCFEQRGICSEYRNIEDIRAEIEAVMRAYKVTEDKDSKDGRVSGDRPRHQTGTERLFLETEIQEEVDKEES